VHELPPEPRRLMGRADLSVAALPSATEGRLGGAILESPAQIELAAQDVERVPFLEVRDRHGGGVITLLGLLSPSNKRPGGDGDQSLTKRERLRAGGAHLVEIDLLRGGRTMPAVNRPECTYSVMVSRAEERPRAGFWPIRLRERLPEVPIPLRLPDGDARV